MLGTIRKVGIGLVEQAKSNTNRLTLTDAARARFKNILDPVAAFINRLGILPNTMTLLGLAGNIVGSYFLATGNMLVGGLIILAMGPIDALDGAMARLRGMAGEFGAFVDSVTDRYSELIIFGGLLYYFTSAGNSQACMVTFLAAAGSVLVSYIRARGQSLGWDTKIGILSRMERFIVLVPSLVFNIPLIGLWIIAILANVTALQRIYDIRRQAYKSRPKKN